MTELENLLKEAETRCQEQQKEIRVLTQIQKAQGKELEKILGRQEYERRIKDLGTELKAAKDRIKDLEKKAAVDAAANLKLHTYAVDLKEKYAKLQAIYRNYLHAKPMFPQNGLPELPEPEPEPEHQPEPEGEAKAQDPEAKSEIKVLQAALRTMQRRSDAEKVATKRIVNNLMTQIAGLKQELKESEQLHKLHQYRLNKPIREPRAQRLNPSPLSIVPESPYAVGTKV